MAEKIKINLLNGDGVRAIEVDFPTDEQWIKRQRARQIIIRQMGRGESTTSVVGGEDADASLMETISGEAGFDPAEAGIALNQLAEAVVEDVSRTGSDFTVRLRTCGGRVTEYTLKRPSAKQVKDYRASFAFPVDLPYNKIEIRTNLKVAADLFDALCPEHSGIPIVHKVPVASAVVAEFDRLLEPSTETFQLGS